MNLDPQWIVGFVDGEGCFHVAINKNNQTRLGVQVQPEFSVVQHERDIELLHALKASFKCGEVVNNHGDRKAFRVRGHANLRDFVVPFFEKHDLKTKKRQDFLLFRKVVSLMENNKHLTEEGLAEIRSLQSQMNRKGSMTRKASVKSQATESNESNESNDKERNLR